MVSAPIGADFEHGAVSGASRGIEAAIFIRVVLSAIGSRAIEIPVAAQHQAAGICAIIARPLFIASACFVNVAMESIQNTERPVGADFEYGAIAVRAAVRRAIKNSRRCLAPERPGDLPRHHSW